MSNIPPKNKKQCPHCKRFIQTGGAFIRHERSCAKKHGTEPQTELGGSPESKPNPPAPTSPWVLWNRGTFRGWAIGRVSKRSAAIVRLETPHLGSISWSGSDFETDVQEGRVFFVNPDQIIAAIREQLDNLSPDDPASSESVYMAISGLDMALKAMESLKKLSQV